MWRQWKKPKEVRTIVDYAEVNETDYEFSFLEFFNLDGYLTRSDKEVFISNVGVGNCVADNVFDSLLNVDIASMDESYKIRISKNILDSNES